MKCRICGTELSKYSRICPFCGSDVLMDEEQKNTHEEDSPQSLTDSYDSSNKSQQEETSEKQPFSQGSEQPHEAFSETEMHAMNEEWFNVKKGSESNITKKRLMVLLSVIAAFLAMFFLFIILKKLSYQSVQAILDYIKNDSRSQYEEVQIEEDIKDPHFEVNSDQDEDYADILNPDLYLKYVSEVDGFSFRYPSNFFCYVDTDLEHSPSDYGINLAKYTFYGNQGSSLTYALYKKSQSDNLIAELSPVQEKEEEELVKDYTLLKKPEIDPIDKGAKVTFTGRNNESHVIYKHIMTNDDYTMILRIDSPDYKDETDKTMKQYFHECIYRTCGFRKTNGKPVRSYQMFLDGVEKE